MKNFALTAFAALTALVSLSTVASAGSYYNDDYSGYRSSNYRHHDYDSDYCHMKKVRWYDDYGNVHWKRVRICN